MPVLRVPNRRGSLWFLLGGLLVILAVIGVVFQLGGQGSWLPAVIGGLGICAVAYGLYGVKRHVEFGDQIVVRYWFRERVIPWSVVTFVHFDRTRGTIRMGLPLMDIPTENHSLTIRLTDGGTVTANIHPSLIAAVAEVVKRRARLDFHRERERRLAETVSVVRWDRGISVVFGLIVSAGGAWFAVSMRAELIDGTSSVHWPTVRANLAGSQVGYEVSTDRLARRRHETTYYFPIVEYRYTVDSRSYTGTRFRFSPVRSTDRGPVEQMLACVRDAQTVWVHYKPGDPALSVLVPGIDAHRYVLVGVAFIAAFGGLIYAVVNLKARDKDTISEASEPGESLELRTWTEEHQPRLLTVAAFDHRAQADLCAAMLDQHGINAQVADSGIVGVDWFLSNAVGGVKVQVAEQDRERAELVLHDSHTASSNKDAESQGEWTCPRCGEQVEGDFDLCWNCQASRPEHEGSAG